jgi:hypothetical protein
MSGTYPAIFDLSEGRFSNRRSIPDKYKEELTLSAVAYSSGNEIEDALSQCLDDHNVTPMLVEYLREIVQLAYRNGQEEGYNLGLVSANEDIKSRISSFIKEGL